MDAEKFEMLLALRSRCGSDSQGFHDYDVANWFDPGKPYADIPTGQETPAAYKRQVKVCKARLLVHGR